MHCIIYSNSIIKSYSTFWLLAAIFFCKAGSRWL